MRALLISSIFPSSREPGRGPYNRSIFEGIARQCEVRVIVPEPFWKRLGQPQELFHASFEDHTGLPVSFPTYWSVPRFHALHAAAMYLSLRTQVKRLRREFAFDVIFAAWGYPDAVAASLLARDLNCPLVINFLGSDINELTMWPRLRRQVQAALARSYKSITVSEALKSRVVSLGASPGDVVVHHNGVDGKRFAVRPQRAARAELKLCEDGPLVCYVGRLSHEKGLDVLIAAMQVLKSKGRSDVKLALVGDGPMASVLKETVRKMDIETQVQFAGLRAHTEIPHWVSACDVLCLPSRREGCPNVILEALASGRPVVASRVGGVPEILTGENGVLVPAEDPEALADGLLEALSRSWDADKLRGAVEYLSWSDVGAKYYNVLCDAVEHHGRPGDR